jgi:putative acyl-CoA dehydrogenase
MANEFSTHEVFNQSPPLEGLDLFTSDQALVEAVAREGAPEAASRLAAFGRLMGSREALERGREANLFTPRLETHDRFGQRLDRVVYHPAYHAAMEASMAEGLHASVWSHLKTGEPPQPGAHVARAAAFYLAAQSEAGHCCPITMTSAALATLSQVPELVREWIDKALSTRYDPRFEPMPDKSSVTFGMGMTEKQGGTDVRANTTRAEPVTGGGLAGEYVLTGHKWFLSAPMSDAFLVLAQAPGGLTCLLLPRFLPDGSVNAIRLLRLKDKLGNRSNASCEIELERAHAWAIGEEGRGVATIIDMVTHTRLDCAVASAGLMRHALANAIHHAEHRKVLGRPLVEQPLMRQVLADLALDVEAATALSLRLARSFDLAADPRAAAWRRLMTPVTKYWVCKVAPALVAEAMECLGGNGYVEEAPLARIYREVPVNAIWEGSGNVMALDVLRVMQREPEVVGVVMEELAEATAGDAHLTAAHARLESILHEPRAMDERARTLVEGLAQLAAGAILRAHAPAAVADAFVATRLGMLSRQTYGVGLDWADTRGILARATPSGR